MTSGQGIVFIAADTSSDGIVVFNGHWDSGERSVLEEMIPTDSAVAAIQWGLDRTDDVRIRFDGHRYFWAGIGSMPVGDSEFSFAGSVSLTDASNL